MLETTTFTSITTNQSPTLLVLWAIHGNEPCGTQAIRRVMGELKRWEISLEQGRLIFIPVCNPQAFSHKKRYFEKNLNRLFNPGINDDSYEWKIAKIVRGYIDQCDYMLDLHSLSGWKDTFMFKSDYSGDKALDRFAQASGIKQVISGWWEIYEDNGEWCTDDYARSVWKKGVCIECWQHNDPQAPDVAYFGIINMMKHLWLLAWEATYIQNQETLHIESLLYKEKQGAFTKKWQHGDSIKQWEIIAQYTDWETIIAQKDQYIMLPKHRAEVWDEWFYLGVKV